jgi:hypothetical protein
MASIPDALSLENVRSNKSGHHLRNAAAAAAAFHARLAAAVRIFGGSLPDADDGLVGRLRGYTKEVRALRVASWTWLEAAEGGDE